MAPSNVDTHPNRLIASLPRDLQDRLVPSMQLVHLEKRQVLYEQGDPIVTVYFPCHAVVSLLTVMQDGWSAEAATIGNEGFLGLPTYLGLGEAFTRAVVQVPGEARAIDAKRFQQEIEQSGYLERAVRRYANALLTQISRSAGCNALHSVEQRTARWLLMTQDRAGADEFAVTQELVGEMFGVHRQSAGLALQSLEEAGLIETGRGRVRIADRPGLESASCECYQAVKEVMDQNNHSS